jgi:hypothetical protein
MSKYFNYFPKTSYTFDGTNIEYVTNLLSKVSFESDFKDNSVIYYEDLVGDGETPEIVAHKIYGSADKHWIILMLNDILHPQFDWPLNESSLNKYIDTVQQPEFIIYKQSLNNGSQSKSTRSYNIQPKFAYSAPIENDFITGTFKRYFIKRRNYTSLSDIFEIDEEQFKLWSKVKAGIDETLYNAIAIDWKLTGPLHDITNNGTIVTYGVSDTNERTIRSNSVKFIGLDKYVTDFKEFTVYSPLCPTEFKQKFGLTK